MLKKHVLLLLLLSCCLTSGKKVEVEYDETTDVIVKDGKVYLPTSSGQLNVDQMMKFREMKEEEGTDHEYSEKKTEHCEEELVGGGPFWFYIFFIFFLTCFAGMMSGLTVGYLSIDDLVLELRTTSGTDEEKEYASKVLPILSNRHWLLVTLLLMNAFAMEALPLFLDKVVPEYLAIVISVSLVLLFGEVIPQAICTGPDQVKIAAYVAPLTRFLMIISSPISYPIAKLLDHLLGEHHKSRFLNNDLKALIELHTFNQLQKFNLHDDEQEQGRKSRIKMGLDDEQANLMISALEMREKKVIEIMIPIKNTFMIDYDEVLDKFKLQLILDKGYSRIPVYSDHNTNDIVGLLRIKNLIGVDITQNKTLRQLGIDLKKPLVISPRLSLIDLLRQFREGRSHMAFITEQVEELQEKYGISKNKFTNLTRGKDNIGFKKDSPLKERNVNIRILGIITLEDVIEKFINLDILDEDDFDKLHKKGGQSGSGHQSANKIPRSYGKELARSLIREEGLKLDAIIKESFSKKKSIKELFLKKGDSNHGSYMGNNYLKDPLV